MILDQTVRKPFKALALIQESSSLTKLFIAIPGEQVDGHDFLHQAQEKNAAAALVEHDCETILPYFKVNHTITAMGQLAHHWRQRFSIPVIAVTGSNGKTTTRLLITEILSAAFGHEAVLCPEANFNTEIGLPLNVISITCKTSNRRT